MSKRNFITCRQCGKKQTVEAARKNGARCSSKTCGEAICVHCGCTTLAACFISQRQLLSPEPDYCYFIADGVCSNPHCVEKAYAAITPAEVRAAQRYYEQHQPDAQRPAATVDDLRLGLITNEADLAEVIINDLLREAEADVLSGLDIDVFDLISANYEQEVRPLIKKIFANWNSLTGREFFICGENLLTASKLSEGVER